MYIEEETVPHVSTDDHTESDTLSRYELERGDDESPDGICRCSFSAPNDQVAEMTAASHLQIAYPIEPEPFAEKRGIRLCKGDEVLFPRNA